MTDQQKENIFGDTSIMPFLYIRNIDSDGDYIALYAKNSRYDLIDRTYINPQRLENMQIEEIGTSSGTVLFSVGDYIKIPNIEIFDEEIRGKVATIKQVDIDSAYSYELVIDGFTKYERRMDHGFGMFCAVVDKFCKATKKSKTTKTAFKNPRHEQNKKIDEVAKYIKTHCASYISQTALEYPLYRGTRNKNKPVFVYKSLEERVPRDGSPLFTSYVNMLVKKSERTADRTNSYYCTGNSEFAGGYGEVYVIFPMGNFHYTWTKWKDAYSSIGSDSIVNKIIPEEILHLKMEEFKEKYPDIYRKVIPYTHENVYVRDMFDDLSRKDPRLIFKMFKDANIEQSEYDHIKGDDGTLSKAIDGGNEIYMLCDSTVYIKKDIYISYRVGEKIYG